MRDTIFQITYFFSSLEYLKLFMYFKVKTFLKKTCMQIVIFIKYHISLDDYVFLLCVISNIKVFNFLRLLHFLIERNMQNRIVKNY